MAGKENIRVRLHDGSLLAQFLEAFNYVADDDASRGIHKTVAPLIFLAARHQWFENCSCLFSDPFELHQPHPPKFTMNSIHQQHPFLLHYMFRRDFITAIFRLASDAEDDLGMTAFLFYMLGLFDAARHQTYEHIQ